MNVATAMASPFSYPGVRAAGMGYAYTAVVDNAYATYWNPAMLASLDRLQLVGDIRETGWDLQNDDLQTSTLAAALPISGLGTVALNASVFKASLFSEQTFGGYVAVRPRPFLYMGVGVDMHYRFFAANEYTQSDPLFLEHGTEVSQPTVSAGLTVQCLDNLKIGAAARNINQPDFSLTGAGHSLPLEARVGMAFTRYPLLLSCDLGWRNERLNGDPPWTVNLGAELTLKTGMDVQLGYTGRAICTGIQLNILSRVWGQDVIDPLSQNPVLISKNLDISFSYAIRFPVRGIVSSFGEHLLGFKVTFGGVHKQRSESARDNLFTPRTPPARQDRIRPHHTLKLSQKDLIRNISTDTMLVFNTALDSVIYRRIQELKQQDRKATELRNLESALQHLLKAITLYNQDNLDRAEIECRQAIALAPNLILAHLRLGSILYQQGKTKKAYQHWKQVFEHDPEHILIQSLFNPLSQQIQNQEKP
jgi:hypothetical protein